MPRNGRAVHTLTDVDPEAGAATCAKCGPTQLKPREGGRGWRCKKGWEETKGDTAAWKARQSATRNALVDGALAALKAAGMPGGETPASIRGLTNDQLSWLTENAPAIARARRRKAARG